MGGGPPAGTALDGLALDLPGFGATPAPPEPWGSPQYADAVASVLSEMAGPVVVVGHSFGGGVALHLVAGHPELVGGLVLTGVPRLVQCPSARRRPATLYRAGRLLHRRGLLADARMEALGQRYGSADYRASAGVMRQVLVRTLAETYEDQLRAVTCPVELVWGDDDTAAPLAVAQSAVELLARPTLTVCPGAGHLTPLSVPGVLRQAIERCRPGRATSGLGAGQG